ncbi:MAG TPA: glycoside hydrolase family 3 N-terminal domain-containing protein, partial [Steroidobacteraceae bacterium]|nr:glycoside hydrolase family 3 N-terminal domain-containing protein [Steroidobacteraceae bacterium]
MAALGALVTAVPWLSAGAFAVGSEPGVVHPQIWPSPKWPLPPDAAIEARVQDLLKRMTLEEKVGQVVQADIASVTPDEARTYHLGSILNGGNSAPGGDEFAPPAKWLELADAFYAASVDESGGRAAIPLIWGTDAVHGHSNIVGATLFPHNVGLGAMRDPALMQKIAAATAEEVRTTGMEWTFAPTVTVPQDVRWGRAYEGYSEDPAVVASYTGVFVRGLQGDPSQPDFLKPPHVLATTKHFLADGGTDQGHDQGDAKISETTLRDIHGAGYAPALEAGVQTVMASFSSWNGVKITGHRGLLTEVLKGRMNFEGFVVSDWNAHAQVAGCTRDNCPQAINAGLDMYMAPDSWKGLYKNLLAQARSGVIPGARLDDAVTRILRVKVRMGLFEAGPPSKRPYGGRFELLGSPEHRAIARAAVRESLVLLKNDNGLLPLKPGQHFLVAGDGADNIAKQSGGWTLTWQGTGLDNKLFPGATSVWGGIRAVVTAAGGSAELSVNGQFKQKPDAAIVVFGENPYAEFQGDIGTLQLHEGGDAALKIMRRLRAQSIPVVAVFLSGRPLWMNREINASTAFVAAWLPGSEGAGIADVLYRKTDGAVAYDFTGRLPFSWPRLVTQDLHKTGQPGYNPLFAFGYGRRYTDHGNLAALSEAPGAALVAESAGVLFGSGKVSSPWRLSYTDEKGGVQPISTVPSTVANGHVRIARVDREAQEDSLHLQWMGTGLAGVELDSRDAFDFTRETNGDVALIVSLRLQKTPNGQVDLGMACGPECGGAVRVDKALAQVQP